MNPNAVTALEFLAHNAVRQHTLSVERQQIGSVEADVITDACQVIVHDGFNLIRVEEDNECTCGARAHNQKVAEAVATIQGELIKA